MDVGDGIRELRENAGMTQAELGKVAGVSSNAVSQWENKRYQDAMEVDASETSEARELRQIDAKIARIETAIEDGLPFDRDRLLALHDRRAELERTRADSSPRKYGRGEVLGLLEKAAQMDSERAIDVFVAAVVHGDDRTAVHFSFDDAPTERLAQVVNWWTRWEDNPTVHPVPGGFVMVA